MSRTENEQTVEILLVEDNPADALLMEEALRDSPVPNVLRVVQNGEEALDCLHGRGSFAGWRRPDLILLDLNLPKKDGREVLSEIKNDTNLRSIPVVVVTTSRSEEDVNRSYDLHANCYVTKPVRLSEFFSLVKKIEEFWFTVVRLPRQNRGTEPAALQPKQAKEKDRGAA